MIMKEINNLIDPIKNILIDNDYEILDENYMFENYIIDVKKNNMKISIHIVNQMS